jgi:hypothetical protein
MLDWRSGRNALAAAILTGMSAWAYQAVSAPGKESEQAWSFDMWCLEMQLYPAKRCDARLPEDLKEYADYHSDVEKYREQQKEKDRRDQEILRRFNRNLPGGPGPSVR